MGAGQFQWVRQWLSIFYPELTLPYISHDFCRCFRTVPSGKIEKIATLFQKFKIQGLLIIGGFEVRKRLGLCKTCKTFLVNATQSHRHSFKIYFAVIIMLGLSLYRGYYHFSHHHYIVITNNIISLSPFSSLLFLSLQSSPCLHHHRRHHHHHHRHLNDNLIIIFVFVIFIIAFDFIINMITIVTSSSLSSSLSLS